jgi:hypothetical protein
MQPFPPKIHTSPIIPRELQGHSPSQLSHEGFPPIRDESLYGFDNIFDKCYESYNLDWQKMFLNFRTGNFLNVLSRFACKILPERPLLKISDPKGDFRQKGSKCRKTPFAEI